MIGRAFQIVLLLLNLVVVAFALYFVMRRGASIPSSPALEYKDFVAILLTAIAVMIALMALAAAALAVWGYAEFKRIARRVARKAAEREAERVGPPLARRVVEEWIAQYVKPEAGGDKSLSEDQIRRLMQALDKG